MSKCRIDTQFEIGTYEKLVSNSVSQSAKAASQSVGWSEADGQSVSQSVSQSVNTCLRAHALVTP